LLRRRFLLRDARELIANLSQFQAALLQNLGREAFLFAQQSQQQMLSADMLVPQTLGFFCRIRQNPLAFVGKRQINRRRHLLANRCVCLNLFSDRLYRRMRAQEAIVKALSSRRQAEQKVLSLDIGRAKLAGLISREEDHAPCLLRIAFEHGVSPSAGYRLE